MPDDEAQLFVLYRQTGDVRFRDALFSLHAAIVESVARGFAQSGTVEKDDLRQVGYIGLLGAIERYDETRGVRFSTYANHRVQGEIRHFLRDKTETIRRPRWMRKLSSQVASFLESYQQAHAHLPTIREISDQLNISQEGVVAILNAKRPVSLEDDKPSGRSAVDSIKSLRHTHFQLPLEDRIAISEAFDRLMEIEQKVIYLFFARDLSQKQIAGKLELSPRKVSRLMQGALNRMRGIITTDEIADVKRK